MFLIFSTFTVYICIKSKTSVSEIALTLSHHLNLYLYDHQHVISSLIFLSYDIISQVSVSRDTAVQPNNTSNDQKGKTFTTKVLMGKDEVSEWFLNSSGLQCDTAKSDRAESCLSNKHIKPRSNIPEFGES